MRVLIAEDDPIQATILNDKLETWGFDTTVLHDGNDTWECIQQPDSPRLLILDWELPGLTGIQLCKRLLGQKQTQAWYIILLTGRITSDDVVAGLEAGADDYVVKPYIGHELLVRINIGVRALEYQEALILSSEKYGLLPPYTSQDTPLEAPTRVLVADDDKVSRHLLQDNLERWGYEVVTAKDGVEALDILQKDDCPTMAILDWMMPGMDGIEVCQRIRKSKGQHPLFLLLLTVKSQSEDIVTGLEAGADDYLSKPFQASELRARLGAGQRILELQQRLIQRAKRSEESFRSIFDWISEGMFQISTDGTIMNANEAMSRILGYESPEEMTLSITNFETQVYLYPDEFSTAKQQLIEHGEIRSYKAEVKRKDDSTIWVLQNIRAIHDQHDQYIGYEGTMVDISAQVLAEHEIRRSHDDLERIIDHRTKDLEQARSEAEEASVQKSRFLSLMNHELRTPLNAVIGYSDLLLESFYGELNPKQSEFVQSITRSGTHLLTLINDLLDVSKIDAGKMELDITSFAPEELVTPSVLMIEVKCREKNIALKTHIDPEVTVIHADLRKCKQVLINFLSNAAKFTPDGGEIDVRLGIDAQDSLLFAVTDTGPGIDSEKQQEVFSEFYQIDHHRDAQLGGTGLGLTLAQRLVHLHKGEVGLTSENGNGSRFWFTIPRVSLGGEARTSSHESTIEFDSSNSLHILVVEDDPANSLLTVDMLKMRGHDIHVAQNGRECLDYLESSQPDIIIMDVHMPEMDGLEAIRHIRADKSTAAVPVIALSASTNAESEQKCLAAGFTSYLAKPIHADSLFSMIQHARTQFDGLEAK